MTLKQWLESKWLLEHRTTRQEIQGLLSIIERDLRDAQVSGVSADWRLAIAYNAALQCAVAALAAAGYRPGRGGSHHYHAIEALKFTLSCESDLIRTLDAFRKKRNIADYERAGSATEREVTELVGLGQELRARLVQWLEREHPELTSPPK